MASTGSGRVSTDHVTSIPELVSTTKPSRRSERLKQGSRGESSTTVDVVTVTKSVPEIHAPLQDIVKPSSSGLRRRGFHFEPQRPPSLHLESAVANKQMMGGKRFDASKERSGALARKHATSTRIASSSKLSYISVSTQTCPIGTAQPPSHFENQLESMVRDMFPGKSKEEAAKRCDFMQLEVQEHFEQAEIAHDNFERWRRRADLHNHRKLYLSPRLYHVLTMENAMLRCAQDIHLKMWKEWRSLLPKSGQHEPQFHLFNVLPPELRRLIWVLSLEPRVIEVRPLDERSLDRARLSYPIQATGEGNHRMHPYGFRWYDFHNWLRIDSLGAPSVKGWPLTRTPYPPQFHVCQESRAEMEKVYEKCKDFWAEWGTVINYEIDTIYCPQDLRHDCNCPNVLQEGCVYPDTNAIWRLARSLDSAKKVRSLAVTYGSLQHMCNYTAPPVIFPTHYLTKFPISTTMPRYPNLREIIFVHLDDDSSSMWRNVGPAKITSWSDSLITEIDGDKEPDIDPEYLRLESEALFCQSMNADYDAEQDMLLHKMMKMMTDKTFPIQRDWYWDKKAFAEKLRWVERKTEGRWKMPALRLIQTTRKTMGYTS
jgi:hypothetical protein